MSTPFVITSTEAAGTPRPRRMSLNDSVTTTTLAGYFLGLMIPNIQEQIHLVIAIVIFLSLLPVIIKFAREKWKARG